MIFTWYPGKRPADAGAAAGGGDRPRAAETVATGSASVAP